MRRCGTGVRPASFSIPGDDLALAAMQGGLGGRTARLAARQEARAADTNNVVTATAWRGPARGIAFFLDLRHRQRITPGRPLPFDLVNVGAQEQRHGQRLIAMY